jgi:hypothetical protein
MLAAFWSGRKMATEQTASLIRACWPAGDPPPQFAVVPGTSGCRDVLTWSGCV